MMTKARLVNPNDRIVLNTGDSEQIKVFLLLFFQKKKTLFFLKKQKDFHVWGCAT
jgi:hypothetical protein